VAQGTFREFFAGDRRARHITDMGEQGTMERGILDDLVWEVDPVMGARVHRGAMAATVGRYVALLRGASPRQLYQEFTAAGTQEIDGREHTVLRMVPAAGKPETWYVDAEGLVARVDMALPAPESAGAAFGIDDTIDAQIGFSDWRVVGGVRLAHRRTLRMGPATVTSVITKVEPGAKIADATFTPPAAVAKAQAAAEPKAAVDAEGKATYQIVEREVQPVASIRIKCKPADISAQLSIVLPEVMAHLGASGGKMAGPPFSRYHAWGDDEIDLEAGIPVQKAITEKGRIKNSTLPAGKAVTCWHVGPYQDLGKAHTALQAWLEANKHTTRGGPWEVYWTDPGMVPDPAKWRTQLFAPIE